MKLEERPVAEALADAEERREFLKKLGKYAIVAPPVAVTLMTYSKRSAASGIGFPPDGGTPGGDPG